MNVCPMSTRRLVALWTLLWSLWVSTSKFLSMLKLIPCCHVYYVKRNRNHYCFYYSHFSSNTVTADCSNYYFRYYHYNAPTAAAITGVITSTNSTTEYRGRRKECHAREGLVLRWIAFAVVCNQKSTAENTLK